MGLGMHMEFDVDLVIPNKDVPFEDGAIAAMSSNPKSYFLCQFAEVLKSRGFSLKIRGTTFLKGAERAAGRNP